MPDLLNPNAGEAFRALRRGLIRSRGFALFVCTCDAVASRDDYIDRLASSMPGVSLQRIVLTEDAEDLLEIVCQSAANGASGPLMIVGLEQVLDGAGAQGFLSALNLRRSEWPQRVPHPVVFWLPRRLLGVLTCAAPDFFDWRSDTFYFPELTVIEAIPLAQREWQYGPDPRLNVEQQAERRSELKARIASAGSTQDEVVLRHVLDWWDELADLEDVRGELDKALRIRKEEALPVCERLGDVRSRAVTMGKIADILQVRGELDEALRIRREDQLPVFERLGDVRSRAVTMGRIADILQARGELDEALRIRQEEEQPVYERLGDVRSRAVTMGRIADILQARGELDEALRIRREELLPVFERLGDVRSRAVTMGQIADILEARGELDEALRIRRVEELPIFERLGDVRSRAVTMGRIADILQARGELDEALRIRQEEQLPVYERLGDVRSRTVTMGKIAGILEARGELDEALRIRQEEALPVFERLGDVRERSVTLYKIALLLLEKSDLEPADTETGHVQQALDALAEAFAIIRQRGFADGIGVVGLRLAEVLARDGRHAEALEVLEQSIAAFDILRNSAASDQARALRAQIRAAAA